MSCMLQKNPDVQQSDTKVNSLRVKLQSADTELEKLLNQTSFLH